MPTRTEKQQVINDVKSKVTTFKNRYDIAYHVIKSGIKLRVNLGKTQVEECVNELLNCGVKIKD